MVVHLTVCRMVGALRANGQAFSGEGQIALHATQLAHVALSPGHRPKIRLSVSYTRLAAEIIYLACADYLLLARHGMVRGFCPTRLARRMMKAEEIRKRNVGRRSGWNPHPADRRFKRLEIKRIQDLEILCAFFYGPVGVLLRISGIALHPDRLRSKLLQMEKRNQLFTGHYHVSKN
jgi:hypothetical protein